MAAPREVVVAAIDDGRRASSTSLLRKLPWVAAGLGALAARDVQAQSTLDFRYLFYKEAGGRTQVLNPDISLRQDFGESGGQLSLLLGYDTISGASPTGAYPTSDTTSSASGVSTTTGHIPLAGYHDTRKSGTLSYARKFGAHLPSIDLSYSRENDYLSKSMGFSDAWTMAHGRGTLHFGASASRDVVTPVTSLLDLRKSSGSYAAGWSWIAGERDLFDISMSLAKLTGYLDDPYKIVPVGTGTLPEHRPDSRSRRAVVGKYAHHFDVRGALKTSYRFYWDDWGIRAHTLDLVYDQHVGNRWIVSPEVRLYTQSDASFYTARLAAPRTFLSADYRLSPFSSLLGGLTVSREVRSGLWANVGATMQSQRGRDRLTPLGSSPEVEDAGSTSSADLDTTTVTVGLSWRY